MSPAAWPRNDKSDERLLLIDPRARRFGDARIRDLPGQVRAGDLLVLNDAATLPASLAATSPRGRAVEVRLIATREDGAWSVAMLGEGDWRTPTEHRPPPDPLAPGDVVSFAEGLRATVERVSSISTRLLDVRFDRTGAALWRALYRQGRPIQYAYLRGPLDLWHVQTAYASRPWAAEMPSAGRPLSWSVLLEVIRRRARIATVTHAAGLSSTGDAALDAALPLTERFEIPEATARAVERTRAQRGRVIAVGTSVVRALEGCAALHGRVVAGTGETDLLLSEGFRRRVVDGLLTGLHEPTASHWSLLAAFAPRSLLEAAYAHAESEGYLAHEFGDSSLILAA